MPMFCSRKQRGHYNRSRRRCHCTVYCWYCHCLLSYCCKVKSRYTFIMKMVLVVH